MKIGIFCSANNDIAPVYFEKTAELGQWIGKNGHSIVYGGCNSGLMECIGKSVHEAGGLCVGVVPRIVEQGGRTSDYVDVHIACDNLSDRKELMMAKSDIFIALPGGIGTLDELFTVAASHTIGYHHKLVLLYDIDGFWQSAVNLLNDLESHGFIRGHWSDYIQVVKNLDEIAKKLQ
ncbi:MAG: TIGR00730 family Rossman fold protein [Prevotella sp.]|jgi:uncharacterized protein (TIGR00730 family)